MQVRLPEFLPASAVVLVVALLPYAVFWVPFQAGLWVVGSALAAIVAVLIALGRRDAVRAVMDLPRWVRFGLVLYAAAAVYGACLGLVAGNPIRYVASQAASMAILPASLVGFMTGTRPTVRRLATGLGLAGIIALAVYVVFFVSRAGSPPVTGEALRFVLPNDVAFTGAAVMTFLLGLAWWAVARTALAAGALVVSGCLLAGGMSRGAWLVTLGGTVLFWWLSKRRRWWTLALLAASPLACAALVLAASSWVEEHARPLAAVVLELPAPLPSDTATTMKQDVQVTGKPVEVGFSSSDASNPPPTLVVEAHDAAGRKKVVARQRPRPNSPSELVRWVQFLPRGTVRLDFWVWQARGGGQVLGLEAHELPGAPAGWVRTLGLRLRTIGTAITEPAGDATMQYRLAEWTAVREAWTNSSPLRLLTGRGLGAVVEFPNSSWDAQGHRVLAPTASYLHNFYVFLGFKLGTAGIAALAGLLMIAGWTWRAALSARSTEGSSPLAAAAACWCAYLVWDVTSPEIISAHTATLLGALLAASLGDAAQPGVVSSQAVSRSQSSSMSSA